MEGINIRAASWAMGPNVGTSSKTIWAVMMGCPNALDHADVPHDPDDFSRCYKLLQLIPEWRSRLDSVALTFPKWIPFVREWETLTWMFEQGNTGPMYDRMRQLEDEGYECDGWKRFGKNGWCKDHRATFTI